MSSTRKIVITTLMAALVLGVAAFPGIAAKPAPEKIFALEIFPNNGPFGTNAWDSYKSGLVTSGTNVDLTAKLFNRTPGNSNFSSFDVSVPSDFVVDQTNTTRFDVTGTNGGNASALVSFPNAATVRVTGIEAVKQGLYVQIAIHVHLDALATCGAGDSEKWSAVAYAGNVSSTTFRQLNENPTLEARVIDDSISASQTSHYLTTTIQNTCTTTINATAFIDVNVNGTRELEDPAEPALDWTFTLDGSTPTFPVTVDSGAGQDYTICEVIPAAPPVWRATTSGDAGTDGTCQTLIDVTPGTQNLLFGNAQDITINVLKYNDVNVNGTQDGGESGLADWTFTVTETGASDITDADGLASFTVPAGGAYEVCETAQDGWANSDPGSLCQTVAATDTTSGATIDLTFGNWATDGILGCDTENNTSGLVTGGAEGEQSGATLIRGANGDESTCELIPYNLDVFTDHVILRKDLTGQETARFQLTVTWGVPFEYGQTEAEFDLDGVPGTGDEFAPTSCTVSGGVVEYPVNPDGSGNYWPALTAEQPWCVAAVTVVPVGDHLEATETYLGSGDPTIRYK